VIIIAELASLCYLYFLALDVLWRVGGGNKYIQERSGHGRNKTTETYTQVSRKCLHQIKSPFDDLSDNYYIFEKVQNETKLHIYTQKRVDWRSLISPIY